MVAVISPEQLQTYLRLPSTDLAVDQAAELANGLVIDVVGEQDTYPARVRSTTLEVAARGYRSKLASQTVGDTTNRYFDRGRDGFYLTDAEAADLQAPTAGPAATTAWAGSMPYLR